jgi:tetratricopeptide (TPR) repeat protein
MNMNQQWLRDIELLLRNGQKEKAASKITRHSSVKDGELDILLAQFLLSYYNCRLEQALTAADASLQAARKAGDNLAEAYALNNKGNSLRMLDRCDEALAAADASLEIARAIGDKLSEANALNNKGITLRMLNRYDEALAAADASLEAARKANDKRTEAYALNNKADTLRMLDRYDEALGSANDSLAVAQGAGDKLAETYALQRMILCQSELGMNDERKESLRQLKIIDPGLAERLETYPVRPRRDDAKPTRPSFDGMLQEIYNKTKSDEKKMRGVLHTRSRYTERPTQRFRRGIRMSQELGLIQYH